MRAPVVFFAVGLIGCGSSEKPQPVAPAPTPAAVASTEPAPATPPTTPPITKEPEGPPLAVANLTVNTKKQGEQRTLDLAWDVTRTRDVPANTVIFVHSACKVGYGNKYEDSSVGGVDAVPVSAARAFKTSAYGFAPLPSDPTFCTFSFAFGPKGSKDETKLTAFCWKNGAITEGACSDSKASK